MLVNESRHLCLILGDTEYGFSFPVKDTLEIFGMEIDNKLNFYKHISNVCKKINNQFNVMLRFRKLTRKEILFNLYKAYILRHFYYCSSVWHFCGARGADKLEALNKRILRFLLGDYSSPYNTLLSKVSSTSLCNKRIQNFLILLYKSLFFTHVPTYMKNMFSLRSSSYDLRGNYILSLSKTTKKQLPMVLTPFLTFQLSSGMHCRTFFVPVFLETLKTKIQDVTFM